MPELPPALRAAIGGPPPAGANTQPGQPPFGSSPVTAPTPNRGAQGQGLALVAEAKQMLEKALSLPGLGAETEIGQAILQSLEKIGKVLPDGAVSPGVQNAGMQQWMMAGRRENPMQAILAALQQGGAGGGAPGGPPGGGAPPPPTPGGGPIPAM
jgi:hypothetical protein